MGKSLDNANLVTRPQKLAFMKIKFNSGTQYSAVIYLRMEGFTELSTSKNATKYSRRYVDEETERTNVTGYSESISYSFDRYKGNSVLEKLVQIHEEEATGVDALVEIITVDMTTAGNGVADAYRRVYTVVPDTDGNTTDCMTYSGTFDSCGVKEKIQVALVETTTDGEWLRIEPVESDTSET